MPVDTNILSSFNIWNAIAGKTNSVVNFNPDVEDNKWNNHAVNNRHGKKMPDNPVLVLFKSHSFWFSVAK